MAQENTQAAVDQQNMIIQLIRRGDSVAQISTLLHVRRSVVEKVLNWYVEQVG